MSIDINNMRWLEAFFAKANNIKGKEALNAHNKKLHKCSNGHAYLFPDVIYPDAGGIIDTGVIGKYKINPIKLCPVCRVNINDNRHQGTNITG